MATVTDPANRLLELMDQMEPRVRRDFLNAVANMTEAFTLSEIVELIETGQLLVAFEPIVEGEARNLATQVTGGFVVAGENTANFLTEALGVQVVFDQTNTRAVEVMRANQLRMVQGFTREQMQATQQALVDGVRRGLNPREQARNFRDNIGLTATQQRAVENYRRLLETRSSDALNRQLRDKRFDSTVRRSIQTDTPLSQEQINRMVSRYQDRYVRYRSEVIARSESLSAVNQATEEAYQQAIDEGIIDAENLEKKWLTARDERVRSSHRNLHGMVRNVNETFPGEDGELMFPGDPSAPASETANCRCALARRITT